MEVSRPVRDALQQVDERTWLLGDRMSITRRSGKSLEAPCWSDGNGCFFEITKNNANITSDEKLTIDDPFELVHDVGNVHAVWKIGTAFLKVMIPASAEITREHITLQALQGRGFTFATPSVLFHGEWDGKYYLIISQVPGATLSHAWPGMDETSRQRCVFEVVRICKEIAASFGQGKKVAGIDGGHLPEYFLGKRSGNDWDFNPEVLLQYCLEIKMDCDTLVFYHCDLGPSNIMVRMVAGDPVVGLIDWECAGFVPKDWVRTKYLVSGGMDFDLPRGSSREARHEWRDRIEAYLGVEDFKEVSESWQAWFATGRSR